MDISSLEIVVAELAEKLSGARVAKIHQPAAELFILKLWNGRENLKLLLSATAQDSRIALTEESFPNPFTPPRFCQLLRARLSRIISFEQVADERIVRIVGSGAKGSCWLMVELTGRGSNLVLVAEDGKIIDALKRSRDPQGRSIQAGEIYRLPERPNSITVKPVKPQAASTVSTSGTIKDLRYTLNRLLQKEKKKLQRRLKNIELERQKQLDFERYRHRGELILANIHLIDRGLAEVEVQNYYLHPATVELISLDPRLNAQQNAQRYFNKYKKSRRGLEHSSRRLAESQAELDWLEQVEFQLGATSEPAVLAELADELKQAGILKEQSNKLPKVDSGGRKPAYLQTLSPGGFQVLWGGSSRQNDTLSTKVLKKGDLWFHAHRCPGSHVILKAAAGQGTFAEEDIRFAAALAAAHSKSKHDSKVEVMVAEANAVRKPSGAKLGMVAVQKYKSLVVQPLSSDQLGKLKNS